MSSLTYRATIMTFRSAIALSNIEKLALNIHKLQKMREGAIEGILDGLDVRDTQTIQKLINAYENPN